MNHTKGLRIVQIELAIFLNPWELKSNVFLRWRSKIIKEIENRLHLILSELHIGLLNQSFGWNFCWEVFNNRLKWGSLIFLVNQLIDVAKNDPPSIDFFFYFTLWRTIFKIYHLFAYLDHFSILSNQSILKKISHRLGTLQWTKNSVSILSLSDSNLYQAIKMKE